MPVECLDPAQKFFIIAQGDEDFVVGLDRLGEQGEGPHVEGLFLGLLFLLLHLHLGCLPLINYNGSADKLIQLLSNSIIITLGQCWQNPAIAAAEPYLLAVPVRETGYDHTVAIFDKLASLPTGQGQGVPASPCQFQQAAELLLLLAADGARAQQIARPHVAARHRVVAQLLGAAPVHVLEVGSDYLLGLFQFLCFEGNYQVDVVGYVIFLSQVWQRLRLLLRQRHLRALQGVDSYDPWRNGGHAVLGGKWA